MKLIQKKNDYIANISKLFLNSNNLQLKKSVKALNKCFIQHFRLKLIL